MKVYECIFVYDDSFVKSGTKFVIYDGHLIPYKSSNGVGLEMKYLGLHKKKKFDKHFKECGEIKVSEVPFISQLIKEHEQLRDNALEDLRVAEQNIEELKNLK